MRITSRRADAVAGATVVAFAGFLYVETTSMSSRITAYPRLLIAIFAVCGVLLLVQSMRPHDDGDRSVFADVAWKPLLASTAVWLATIPVIELLGFYAAVTAMMAALVWILEDRERSRTTVLRAIGFGGGMALLLWVVFRWSLGVITPSGVLL